MLSLPVIHTMWLGETLSGLELLTLASFRAQGHPVTLWAYDALRTPLPNGVVLADAEAILPRARIKPKRDADHETGIGKGSFGGVFSDLFRYKLLFEHGGIWSDMDVTALRPLAFAEEYVFRPHQLGMVGSIMKCPKGSRLMQDAYAATEAIADEHTPWMLPIRLLNSQVRAAGLEHFIRPELSNLDHWDALRPFIEERRRFPEKWYAVHWMNELWRTLQAGNGQLNGRLLTGRVLDKDAPPPGSMLHELYRRYGLADPYEPYDVAPRHAVSLPAPALAPPDAERFDALLPALTQGEPERRVIETLLSLATGGTTCRLHLLDGAGRELPIPAHRNLTVHRPAGSRQAKLRAIAMGILAAGGTRIYTHLIPAEALEILWEFGIETIPVVDNAQPDWLDAPARYNHRQAKLVVAATEPVARQLRQHKLTRPVTVLRHELQTYPDPARLGADRYGIRRRYGIGDDTMLVGMAGQFAPRHAYSRAIKALAALRDRGLKARLLVLGGWDGEAGRAAYKAFMREAVEADLVADIICPGFVDSAAPYYAAFDAMLSTSGAEDHTFALLEALATGCPVVAADGAGASALPQGNITLIAAPDDADAYADAIIGHLTQPARIVPPPPLEPDLIPLLWRLLGRFPSEDTMLTGALLLTQTLELGGPASSLARLAAALGDRRKCLIGVFGGVTLPHQEAIEAAGAKLLSAAGQSLGAQAQTVLAWIAQFRPKTLCFWNLRPELKLLLVKLLEPSKLRIVDVSPGPMLFDELAACAPFQHRIAFGQAAYFGRLDHFVSLYHGGEAPDPACNIVLPLGTPAAPAFIPLPEPHLLPPRGYDPALVVGTVCRIVPAKQVEVLLDVAKKLRKRVPGAQLVVVGGPDASSVPYFQELYAASESEPALHFVGPAEDPWPFLRMFRVFLLTGTQQGCPNASLEAMSLRLPVVAQADGGVAEQVIHGVTGYLAQTAEAMARRVASLLKDEALRSRLGEAAYSHWHRNFSVDVMAARYDRLLFD